jgi:protein SCO1/2
MPPGDEQAAACAPATEPASNLADSPLQVDGEWETDTGRMIRLSDLRGKPRVFAMFFTACQGTCSLTVDSLRQLEASLPMAERSEVGFVLVTFDPRHDSRAALAAYRHSANLSPDRWLLLRGSAEQTADLAKHLNLTFNPRSSRGFVHSSGLTLVDSAGRIVHQQLGLHPDLTRALAAVKAATTDNAEIAKSE